MSNDVAHGAAERLVGDLKKEFLIVGNHRVHGWYAWAIVGLMFGMALTVVSLANRQGELSSSRAAAGVTSVTFNAAPSSGTLHSAFYAAGEKSDGFFVANVNGNQITGNPTALTQANASKDVSFVRRLLSAYNIKSINDAAIYINADKTAAWMQKVTNGQAYLDLSQRPDAYADRRIILTFQSYIWKNGAYVKLPLSATTGPLEPGFYLGGDTASYNPDSPETAPIAYNGYSFSREIKNGVVASVPGMPLYSTRLKITDGKNTYGHPDLKFAGFERSGTVSLYWKDTVSGDLSNLQVVSIDYVPNANRRPVFEPVADITIEGGKTATFTAKASDPDGDPVTYRRIGSPSGSTFNPNTGVFTWLTPTNISGAYSVTIEAADDQGGKATLTVRINVTLPLPPPAPPTKPPAQGAIPDIIYCSGANQVKIASFTLTADASEGIRVSSLTFDKDTNANFDIQNLKVLVGQNQFGLKVTVADQESAMTFNSSSPLTIPAGGSTVVDLYADILASSMSGTTFPSVLDLIGWSATGNISGNSKNFPGAMEGQSILLACGPTLTLSNGSNNPITRNLIMGSTGNSLFAFKMSNNNIDDVRVTDIMILDIHTSLNQQDVSLNNFELFNGTTKLAGPITPQAASGGNMIMFSLPTPLVITKNSWVELILKGAVATYSSGNARSGSSHTFMIQGNDFITARSVANSSATVTTIGAPVSSNTQTVYRTKLSLSTTPVGQITDRNRSEQDLARLTISADPAYQALLQRLTLTFAGTAVSAGTVVQAQLIDFNTNTILTNDDNTSTGTVSCTTGASNTCAVTFNLNRTLSAGEAKTVTIRSSTSFANSSGDDGLSVTINATGDLLWSDGTTSNIPLESSVVPFTVANVSYQ